MKVGDRIRRARVEKGLSVRALGNEIGVTGSAISQWENENTRLKPVNAVKLSDVLGIPISELMPSRVRRSEITVVDPQEILLVEKFRELSVQLKEAHLRLLLLQVGIDEDS